MPDEEDFFKEFDEAEKGIELHLAMAEALDEMDEDVTEWEASFLESVLRLLRDGLALTEPQARTLEEMRRKYIE
jgi:hypothetical protein